MLGRLHKAEIDGQVFKGIGLNTYSVIDSYNSDLKMKNQLNAVDCVMHIWDMIDTVDYSKEPKLSVLVNSIYD